MTAWSDKTFNLLTDFISVLIVTILLSFAVYWAIQKPVFWLKAIDVTVYGNQEAIRAPQLVEQLKGKVKGTFFTVDIAGIRDALKDIPWVREVAVKREWPNKLQIYLHLYKPVALWGEQEVLAQDGTIFPSNQAIAETDGPLPRIDGPKEESARIYQQFLNFEKVCEKNGLQAGSLDLNTLSGWVLTMKKPGGKNIDVIFKGTDSSETMVSRLESIIKSLPRLSGHFGAEPTRIDARYNRGVAVERPEPEEEQTEEEQQPDTETKDAKEGR